MVYVSEVERPDWDTYFMGLAYWTALRSPDSQTKHGSALVAQDNHLLATGYNGPPSNVDDTKIPAERDSKYDFFIHSEANALAYCAREGISSLGAKIYITGKPCLGCLRLMIPAGIKEIIYGRQKSHCVSEDDQDIRDKLLSNQGIKVREYSDFDNLDRWSSVLCRKMFDSLK